METGLHLALFTLGTSIALACLPSRQRGLAVFVAYPVGCVVLCGVGLVAAGLGLLHASTITLVGVTTTLVAAWFAREHLARHAAAYGLAALALVALCAATLRVNHTVVSYDSVELLIFGSAIASTEGFSELVAGRLASWGPFLPIIHAMAVNFGLEYFSSFQTVFAATGAVAIAALLYRLVAQQQRFSLPALAVAVAAITFLASTWFVWFQAFYIHNSMPSALYLAIAVLTAANSATATSLRCLFLPGIALVGFMLQRTEAPLFMAAWAICAWSCYAHANKSTAFLRFVAALWLVMVCWYAAVASKIGTGSDILTPGRIAIALAPMTLLLVWVALRTRLRWKMEVERWWAPLMAGLLLAAVLGGAAATDHLAQSLNAVWTNALETGLWYWSWPGAMAAFAVAVCLFPSPVRGARSFWASFLISGLSLLILASAFRDPYRLGWGDSANRMLTHFLPVATLYPLWLAGLVASGALHLRHVSTRVLLGVSISVAVAAPLTLWVRMAPENVLSHATIHDAPDWQPGYDLERILERFDASEYLSSHTIGETTLMLELETPVTRATLEVHDYAEGLTMERYQWAWSSDGIDWTIIHDTDAPGFSDSEYRPKPLLSCYDLTTTAPVRYLRLVFREGLGQNRILLRKIGLFVVGWRLEPGIRELTSRGPSECLQARFPSSWRASST